MTSSAAGPVYNFYGVSPAQMGVHTGRQQYQKQCDGNSNSLLLQLLQQQMITGRGNMQQQPLVQAAPGGQTARSAPAAFSPQGAGHWHGDGHMASVRLDEGALRRIEQIT